MKLLLKQRKVQKKQNKSKYRISRHVRRENNIHSPRNNGSKDSSNTREENTKWTSPNYNGWKFRLDEITQNGWTDKDTEIQKKIVCCIDSEALYQMSRAEYKTEPDKIRKDLIRLLNFLPKRNTYHNRGHYFWKINTETETPEDFWRRLIESEKKMRV